jgi:hypothetical protein
MSFFSSDIVQEEVRKISSLQKEVYENMFNFVLMDKDRKLKHLQVLEELIETQKLLYTRLSLSDDPEAKEMKQHITNHAVSMGMPSNVDLNILLDNMRVLLEDTRKQVDNS